MKYKRFYYKREEGKQMILNEKQAERVNLDLMVFLKENASKEEIVNHIKRTFSSEIEERTLLSHVQEMLENDGQKVMDFFKSQHKK